MKWKTKSFETNWKQNHLKQIEKWSLNKLNTKLFLKVIKYSQKFHPKSINYSIFNAMKTLKGGDEILWKHKENVKKTRMKRTKQSVLFIHENGSG